MHEYTICHVVMHVYILKVITIVLRHNNMDVPCMYMYTFRNGSSSCEMLMDWPSCIIDVERLLYSRPRAGLSR